MFWFCPWIGNIIIKKQVSTWRLNTDASENEIQNLSAKKTT